MAKPASPGGSMTDQDVMGHPRSIALHAASKTLFELFTSDPAARGLALSDGALPDRDGYMRAMRSAHAEEGMAGVRRAKRRRLLQIAARDLAGEATVEQVTEALADLADACLAVACDDSDGQSVGLAVIAMGKLGGRELNYVSDIDILFMSDSDTTEATKAASAVLRSLGEFAPEGQPYIIDTNLRPEGRNGPLVRSREGFLQYYRKWAKPWEFQALIKARAAAGDTRLGIRFVGETRAFVFPAQVDPIRVGEIRRMKQRVEEHAQRTSRRGRTAEAEDVKLGPGGIRDIEFAVQLLQLVHGGADGSVTSGRTLDALKALVDGGYIAEDDGAGLAVAYRWLRAVEHRLQLWQERRVRHLPSDEESLSRLARVMGFHDTPSESAAARFYASHQSVLSDVRSRFEKLFYRPMIESLAEPGGPRLSAEALKDRLRVLGFRDVERAARTLGGLVSGTSRRARLFRVLTPAVLKFLATTPLPDEGLFQFLLLGESLETRVDILGALRDNPPGVAFLAQVLGSGKLLGQVLIHVPEEIGTIADPHGPGGPKDRDRLIHEAHASLEWRAPEDRLDGLRRFKRKELLRIALSDIGASARIDEVGRSLSDLADACVDAALPSDSGLAIIGMGKLGGRELNYASDIDVMFVGSGDPQRTERHAEELMKAIGEVTPEGQAFRIDAALRPEGKSGPLVRSIESFAEYWDRWAKTWEFQSLTKARVVAGDSGLGERFIAHARERIYANAVSDKALAEIRHLKARMEKERIPRGSDPRRHIKLGPGGMSDVEFTAQILQLRFGHAISDLTSTSTRESVEAARLAELLTDEEAQWLLEAYAFLARARNRLFFMAGKPVDVLPTKPEELEALGIALGFTDAPRQEAEEEFLKVTRRARKIAEKTLYG
ncbi:MAG: bifunctional glutamine-synthetase adenylyltransferase/deadenyltransferase [Actinomycetota bacterium]|nr:bifunctional glutamine-synthetase adenylyltransferase/deadenyltransferase [Actinomycetota bacterium]